MENTASGFINFTPSVGGALSFGWEKMKSNFLHFFLVVFILTIIDIPLNVFDYEDRHFEVFRHNFLSEFAALAYFFLFLPVIEYGADLLFVHGVRGQKLDFKVLIEGFYHYQNVILSHLLVFGLVSISFIALIIPGIIVACRLVLVSYLVMDKGLEPIPAVETSWKMTRGHGWKVFGLAITSFFIIVLGLIFFIVGIFPAVMWVKAAFASLYQSILEEKGPEIFAVVEEQKE